MNMVLPSKPKKVWIPTGKPVAPLKNPSSPSASVFALQATPRQDAAIIRLIFGVTSRPSINLNFWHSSTDKPVVFCVGGQTTWQILPESRY